MRVFPAAITGTTKKDQKAARVAGMGASRGIEHFYDKLLLDPSAAPQAVRSHFEAAAARSFLRSNIGPPRSMDHIQITYRAVHMGVDAHRAKNAIATVTVLLKGDRNSKRLKLKHESTLWLEHVHRSWKVLAFRVRQRPR